MVSRTSSGGDASRHLMMLLRNESMAEKNKKERKRILYQEIAEILTHICLRELAKNFLLYASMNNKPVCG
jgi:hypothetical protein